MAQRRSYISNPSLVEYTYQTAAERLNVLADEDPTRDAFVFYDMAKRRSSLTRKQLLDSSTSMAKKLVGLGVKKGTTVTFCMSNSLEMLVIIMGVSIAGGIGNYVNVGKKDGSDLVEVMDLLKSELLIIDTDGDDANWKVLDNIWPLCDAQCSVIPSLKMIIYNGIVGDATSNNRISLKEIINGPSPDNVRFPDIQPEDTLAYFCTSGSTGKPKVVTYTHFCTLNWSKQTNLALGMTDNSAFFCDRTFSWALGYPRTYLVDGTIRVFIDTRMSVAGTEVDNICDVIKNENCDVVFLPGYLTVDIIKNKELRKCFSKVRTVFLGGERISKAHVEMIMENVCRRVLSYYGTTEVGGTSTFISDDIDDYENGIIGTPLNGAEMKIVNADDDVVRVGEQGEIVVRSVWHCAGYKNMPEVSQSGAMGNGWFRTGDIGHMREDGNLVVDGRQKEMISTATLKYFPWTIEQTLRQMPGASHVFAVGVPDERLGQVICACVVPKPDVLISKEDISRFCDQSFFDGPSSMGVSLKPRYFVILRAVPLTQSGKIDRRTVGIMAKQQLGQL